MNQAVLDMLATYDIHNATDAENALKEIIQELMLLGLHRANFFEKAAFYGGTALRILYGLPRFSEDMDFTLFKPDSNFSLTPYFSAIEKELEAFGFKVEIQKVDKKIKTDIDSAFLKANTKITLLNIESLKKFSHHVQANSKIQIKFEVDTDPATNFEYEARYLTSPTEFPVLSLKKPDLFAGKINALLFRKWKGRTKGRDFYDYAWYLKNKTPVRLSYFHEQALRNGNISKDELKTLEQMKAHLIARFQSVDFQKVKDDVLPFIKDPSELSMWSADFFIQITEQLQSAS